MKTMTQEVFQRKNITKSIILEQYRCSIMNKIMQKLKFSGYTEKERYNFLKGGINTCNNIQRKESECKWKFYRPWKIDREKK